MNCVRMYRERLQVFRVGSKHGSARLGARHYQGIDGRAAPREAPKQGGPARDRLWDESRNVTSLEKAVYVGVAPGVPLQAFSENYGDDARRPKALVTKRHDQR